MPSITLLYLGNEKEEDFDLTGHSDFDELVEEAKGRFRDQDNSDPDPAKMRLVWVEDWFFKDYKSAAYEITKYVSNQPTLNQLEGELDDFFYVFGELRESEEDITVYYHWRKDACGWASNPSGSDFNDAKQGKFDDQESFARYMADSLGLFENCNETVEKYFDFDAYGNDLFKGDFCMVEGTGYGNFVFANNY
jgi:antirestriction protein